MAERAGTRGKQPIQRALVCLKHLPFRAPPPPPPQQGTRVCPCLAPPTVHHHGRARPAWPWATTRSLQDTSKMGRYDSGDRFLILGCFFFIIQGLYFPFFFGTEVFLACHRWLWMVMASTLTDTVLAGMTVNCFRSELYLYSLSIIFLLMLLGPVPVSFRISSVSGKYE